MRVETQTWTGHVGGQYTMHTTISFGLQMIQDWVTVISNWDVSHKDALPLSARVDLGGIWTSSLIGNLALNIYSWDQSPAELLLLQDSEYQTKN